MGAAVTPVAVIPGITTGHGTTYSRAPGDVYLKTLTSISHSALKRVLLTFPLIRLQS